MKVVLDNIENNLKEEILKSLKEIFNRYPKLINKIDIITDFDTINFYTLNNYKYKRIFDRDIAFTSVFIETSSLSILIGVNNNYDLKEMNRLFNLSYKKGWSYTRCVKDALYHELGHIFSYIYNLKGNNEFVNTINKLKCEVSMYASNNMEELIAECFTKYSYDRNYNDLVNFVGTVIDKVYERVDNKSISSKTLKTNCSN